MSAGMMWPGSFAANVTMPAPRGLVVGEEQPAAAHDPLEALHEAAVAAEPPPVPMCWDIWMFGVIQDSSPWVETTCSPGCRVTSRTGIVVPLISACIDRSVLARGRCPIPASYGPRGLALWKT